MKFDFYKIWKFLANVFFPRICLHCKRDIHYLDDNVLCPSCFQNLQEIPEFYCKTCGVPLEHGAHCFDCRKPKNENPECSIIRARFVFNPQIRSVIHSFKYHSKPYLAKILAGWLLNSFERYPELKGYDSITAIPLHPRKAAQRGYNQSELLAEIIAEEKNLTLLDKVVARKKETKSQAKLTRKERIANISGAFEVLNAGKAKGRRILLIDDVATTGSTMQECAGALKKAGAKSVAGLVVARES
ncbi:MAG: ComF family protein [Elusimicrobia bacterium]|nr:ComF family protein [Elusimicrobiota bacterium]